VPHLVLAALDHIEKSQGDSCLRMII
jgi:hypothetical protein